METEQKINLPNTYRNFTPQTSEENVSQDKTQETYAHRKAAN